MMKHILLFRSCAAFFLLSICLFILFVSIPAGKPQIIEKTENGVTLTWTRSTKVGASSLVGYTVEMYGRNATENWIPIASRVQNTTYTHTGLIAGVSYFFVIRAENAHGMSAPSPLSEPIVLGIVSEFILIIFYCFLDMIFHVFGATVGNSKLFDFLSII